MTQEPSLETHLSDDSMQQCIKDLERFLGEENVSPVSGLAKRFSDLDLFEETKKLPDSIKLDVQAGMVLCYILKKKSDKYLPILRSPDNVLTEEHLFYFITKLDISNLKDHLFETAVFDRKSLANKVERLERDYGVEEGMAELKWTFSKPHLRKGTTEYVANHTYTTANQLLGISLIRGDLKKAKRFAEKIKTTPTTEITAEHDKNDAVIEYLEQGGYDVLKHKASFALGTNSYWWADRTGKYGEWRHQMNGVAETILTGRIAAITYVAVAAGSAWVLDSMFGTKADELEKMIRDTVQNYIGMMK